MERHRQSNPCWVRSVQPLTPLAASGSAPVLYFGGWIDGNSNDSGQGSSIDRRNLDAGQRKPAFLHSGERWRLGASMRSGSVRSWTQDVSSVVFSPRSYCGGTRYQAGQKLIAGAGSNPAGGVGSDTSRPGSIFRPSGALKPV